MRGRQLRTPLAIKTKTKGRSYAHIRHSKVGYRRDRNAKGCIVFGGEEPGQEQQLEKEMRSSQLSQGVCRVPNNWL
jgi:hypothetical protein